MAEASIASFRLFQNQTPGPLTACFRSRTCRGSDYVACVLLRYVPYAHVYGTYTTIYIVLVCVARGNCKRISILNEHSERKLHTNFYSIRYFTRDIVEISVPIRLASGKNLMDAVPAAISHTFTHPHTPSVLWRLLCDPGFSWLRLDSKIFTAKTSRIKCLNLDIADFATIARKPQKRLFR